MNNGKPDGRDRVVWYFGPIRPAPKAPRRTVLSPDNRRIFARDSLKYHLFIKKWIFAVDKLF